MLTDTASKHSKSFQPPYLPPSFPTKPRSNIILLPSLQQQPREAGWSFWGGYGTGIDMVTNLQTPSPLINTSYRACSWDFRHFINNINSLLAKLSGVNKTKPNYLLSCASLNDLKMPNDSLATMLKSKVLISNEVS